ncbi:MAG: virulence RhuM family protein [Actinobacteria bacterium]|nr:virulence RhuM family protein [Actinomycetota bacterium]
MKDVKKPSKKQLARSSAAEYLTYISAVGDSRQSIELRYENENIWMTQKMMAELYGVSVSAINQHIKKLFNDSELNNSVIKRYLITASDGKNYDTVHYNLQAIISVGFKIENERAVQFRKWAREIVKDYTIKGFAMDDDRLKQGGSILSKQFFEELLTRIREIRLSERKFYQKITDIYATAIDYDYTAESTKRFFATVQNKLHWAIHGQTAAEVIAARASADKEHMGLTTWKDAPEGKIQKFDVSIAKNYLKKIELAGLERIVSAYLDIAEDMAVRKIPMTMSDWEERLDRFIVMTDREVLRDSGKISHELAKEFAESEFEKYRITQDGVFESDFDRFISSDDFHEMEKRLESGKKSTKQDPESGRSS